MRLTMCEPGSDSGSVLQIFFSFAGLVGAGTVAAAGGGAGWSAVVPADASKNATIRDITNPRWMIRAEELWEKPWPGSIPAPCRVDQRPNNSTNCLDLAR